MTGNGNATDPLGFDVVKSLVMLAMGTFAHMDALTFSPKSNKSYDVRHISQGYALFWELIKGGSDMDSRLPIYLIAITCHTSTKMDHIMRESYRHASLWVNQPLIGVWTDDAGVKYFDVVIPVQFPEAFKSDKQALELGRKYEQDVILRMDPDGNSEFLETH